MGIKNLKNSNFILMLNSILVITAFVISDWRFVFMGQTLTLSDVIMTVSMTILLLMLYNQIYKYKWIILAVIGALVLNVSLNKIFNPDFVLKTSIIYFIKIPVYLLFFVLNVEFYVGKYNVDAFYKVLRMATFIAIGVGIYINVVLFFKLNLPYEFFWTFTRKDPASYTFRNSDIIRMRSVFSEPSYLGLYLNFVLALNYFSPKIRFQISKWDNLIITLGIILTLSFGALLLMLFIKLLYLSRSVNWKSVVRHHNFKYALALMLVMLVVGLYVFHPILYKTVYYRFFQIITGEDTSAILRLVYSWSYIDNLLIGNGVGQTPAIWNNFAYVLSDWGIIVFIMYIYWFVTMLRVNPLLIISVAAFHFLKGGYLSAFHVIMMLITVIFINLQKQEGVA